MERIILFDGECNFCNSTVQFVIKRDPKAKFKFASLQSDFGQKIRMKNNLPEELDSLIFLEGEKVHVKSSAALKISKDLKGLWKLAYVFIIVPRPLRDIVYDFIARNRYKWFGKRESCMIPSKEEKLRFLN